MALTNMPMKDWQDTYSPGSLEANFHLVYKQPQREVDGERHDWFSEGQDAEYWEDNE